VAGQSAATVGWLLARAPLIHGNGRAAPRAIGLFIPQRGHGIEPGRAPRRNHAGHHGNYGH